MFYYLTLLTNVEVSIWFVRNRHADRQVVGVFEVLQFGWCTRVGSLVSRVAAAQVRGCLLSRVVEQVTYQYVSNSPYQCAYTEHLRSKAHPCRDDHELSDIACERCNRRASLRTWCNVFISRKLDMSYVKTRKTCNSRNWYILPPPKLRWSRPNMGTH